MILKGPESFEEAVSVEGSGKYDMAFAGSERRVRESPRGRLVLGFEFEYESSQQQRFPPSFITDTSNQGLMPWKQTWEEIGVYEARDRMGRSKFLASQGPPEDEHRGALSEKESTTFVTARTEALTFYSAKSSVPRGFTSEIDGTSVIDARRETEYTSLLEAKNLWPVDPLIEQNWSGRGQHAEFEKSERRLVDGILQVQDLLGSTSSAVVHSVKCRRILLARKTIRCNRRMTRDKAIDEVAHLNRLEHSHIVRVIGTYVLGQELSILIYPVAQYNLATFIEESLQDHGTAFTRSGSLMRSLSCLSSALAYIHRKMVKHMDIKPTNILVRYITTPISFWGSYHFYIADFGIARSYSSLENTDTDGPTMFTRKYAAPEVVDHEKRGFSADVFSMGCVFTEILAALVTEIWFWNPFPESQRDMESLSETEKKQEFTSILQGRLAANEYGDTSYQANIHEVHALLDMLRWRFTYTSHGDIQHVFSRFDFARYVDVIKDMVDPDPKKRPSAVDILEKWDTFECCKEASELLEAAVNSC